MHEYLMIGNRNYTLSKYVRIKVVRCKYVYLHCPLTHACYRSDAQDRSPLYNCHVGNLQHLN